MFLPLDLQTTSLVFKILKSQLHIALTKWKNSFPCLQLNSDVIYRKSDKYGNTNVLHVDTAYVGKLLVTKRVNANSYEDVTSNYKYPEGKFPLV